MFGLFIVTLLWGGTFVWMKQAMNSLDSELDQYSTAGVVGVIVASRFLIAFLALLPFSSKARAALASKEDWKGGLILGSLMVLRPLASRTVGGMRASMVGNRGQPAYYKVV